MFQYLTRFLLAKKTINTLLEIPKAGSNHTCLAVISLDSTLNKDGNYYPQLFLKECKYIKKNNQAYY